MTILNFSKENNQTQVPTDDAFANDAEQILHLKRLLVTLKQHYEKTITHLQSQLQLEKDQYTLLEQRLECAENELKIGKEIHEEELAALRDQQNILKELLNKAQEKIREEEINNLESSDQRVEQLERFVPYLRTKTEEAHLETEQLREALDEAQRQRKELEDQIDQIKAAADKEIEELKQILEFQRKQEDSLETVVSTTSSHYLRQELQTIKETLIQGAQETKALENRYIEILNEKIGLEHQFKQLQIQFEHQSSNLASFQSQLNEMEKNKKGVEMNLQSKEGEMTFIRGQNQELQERIRQLDELVFEKNLVQDRYEQLKEEWRECIERLDEEIEMRAKAEDHISELKTIVKNQETQLKVYAQQLEQLHEEKRILEIEKVEIQASLDDCENRIKISQQHLAKKVKESALLSEKVEEQQINLNDFIQTVDHQKMQVAQLQASVEIYQKHEKRLQEQLNEALKGNENQIVKWEEKYFRMYDKWQECENRIRELRKYEEKHAQMQNLLNNLGNFIGNPYNGSTQVFHHAQEVVDRQERPLISEEPSIVQEVQTERTEEKYDLFGMRRNQDKFQPHSFQ